jgi:hypothetical protein
VAASGDPPLQRGQSVLPPGHLGVGRAK